MLIIRAPRGSAETLVWLQLLHVTEVGPELPLKRSFCTLLSPVGMLGGALLVQPPGPLWAHHGSQDSQSYPPSSSAGISPTVTTVLGKRPTSPAPHFLAVPSQGLLL